jgi:hypothetical protein
MVLAIAVGLLGFALSPFFDAIGVYVMPAEMLAPVIGPPPCINCDVLVGAGRWRASIRTSHRDQCILLLDYCVRSGPFRLALAEATRRQKSSL